MSAETVTWRRIWDAHSQSQPTNYGATSKALKHILVVFVIFMPSEKIIPPFCSVKSQIREQSKTLIKCFFHDLEFPADLRVRKLSKTSKKQAITTIKPSNFTVNIPRCEQGSKILPTTFVRQLLHVSFDIVSSGSLPVLPGIPGNTIKNQ